MQTLPYILFLLVQDHLNLLKIVKGDIFVFADVSSSIQSDNTKPLSLRPQLEKDEWDDYCNKINEISNRLFDHGIPMSYHEHMGTIIQSEDDVNKFMEKLRYNKNPKYLNDEFFVISDPAFDWEEIIKTTIS